MARCFTSNRFGSLLLGYQENGSIEARTTVQHVTDNEATRPETKSLIEKFDIKWDKRLDNTNFHLKEGEDIYEEDDFISHDNEN